MEGTVPINLRIMEGTPPLRGEPYPVFKCSQYFKIKINVNTCVVLTLILTLTF
jgi:hypothetical protein